MMPKFLRSKLAQAMDDDQAERDLIDKIDRRVRSELARERHDQRRRAAERADHNRVGAVDRVEFPVLMGPIVYTGLLKPVCMPPDKCWATGLTVNDLMKTTKMPSWREIKTEEGKPVGLHHISMFELSLLAWRASHGIVPYPRGPGLGNPATVISTLKKLEIKGLIKFGNEPTDYSLTPRAECLIEAMISLPLPIKQDPPWTMPGK